MQKIWVVERSMFKEPRVKEYSGAISGNGASVWQRGSRRYIPKAAGRLLFVDAAALKAFLREELTVLVQTAQNRPAEWAALLDGTVGYPPRRDSRWGASRGGKFEAQITEDGRISGPRPETYEKAHGRTTGGVDAATPA